MYKERIEEIVDDHYEEGVKKLKIKHIDQYLMGIRNNKFTKN